MIRSIDYPSSDDVILIDWHSSGFFSNTDSAARASFLGASAAPDTYFDGVDNIVGAGDSVAAYNQYKPIVDTHYADGSVFIIRDAYFDYDLQAWQELKQEGLDQHIVLYLKGNLGTAELTPVDAAPGSRHADWHAGTRVAMELGKEGDVRPGRRHLSLEATPRRSWRSSRT